MRKTKTQKGITLIALIITIIVLFILAVVAIGAVQNDGIINYAKNARDEYGKAQVNENTTLQNYLEKINKHAPQAEAPGDLENGGNSSNENGSDENTGNGDTTGGGESEIPPPSIEALDITFESEVSSVIMRGTAISVCARDRSTGNKVDDVTWSTSDSSIAKIASSNGSEATVHTKGGGEVYIYATLNSNSNIVGSGRVLVDGTVNRIDVVMDGLGQNVNVGSTFSVSAVYGFGDQYEIDDVTWSTSDSSIAEITSSNGGKATVLAKGAGEVEIYATWNTNSNVVGSRKIMITD